MVSRGAQPMADAQLATVIQYIRRLVSSPEVADTPDREILQRFQAGNDPAAFAALVERHGALVLRLCRRVLQHEQDAEDAFQATFLVLARKAGSIRGEKSLAGWLHGVAYRIAMQAKRNARRRRAREARAKVAAPANPAGEIAWREVQAILDEEIQRLPEKCRTPFILCCLESHSRAEVARQLAVPEGTVWSRLAQARKRLQGRLARRGIDLGAVLAVATVVEGTGRAALPALLVTSTVRAVSASAAGAAGLGISAEVTVLVQGALKSMAAMKATIGLAILLLASAVGAGVGALVQPKPVQEPPAENRPRDFNTQASKSAKLEAKNPAVASDRYGDPLPEKAVARLGTVRFRQGSSVHLVDFSPDGKTLLLGGSGRGLGLWDASTGKEIRQFGVGANEAHFSPDGKLLASVDIGTTVWDVASGKRVRQLDDQQHFAACLAFAPDGKILATGTDPMLNLWDVTTGKKLRQFKHGALVRRVVFASGGKTLASAGEDGNVRLWDVASGKELRRWETTAKGPFHALAASPAGPWLAHGGGDEALRTLSLLDARTGKEVRLQAPSFMKCACVVFSPNGQVLASGHYDGTIHLWDPATGNETARFKTQAWLHSLAFSPDGKVLVSSGRDGSGVQWWDVANGKEIPPPQIGHQGWVQALGFSRDGKGLFSLGGRGDFIAWNLPAGAERSSFRLPIGPAFMFSPDGRKLLSIELEEYHKPFAVTLRDTATGKKLSSLGKVPLANLVAFTADGKRAALAEGGDGSVSVSVWDVDRSKQLYRFTSPGGRLYFCLAFSPDGKKLAAGSWNAERPNFHLWDLDSGKKVSSCDPDHWVNSIAFSADGKKVALGSGGDFKTCVSVWDLASANQLQKFTHPASEIVAAFSPTGRFLTVAGSSKNLTSVTPEINTIHVWEIATGQKAVEFLGHHSGVTSLAFAPDGKTLASGGGDSSILIWDLIGRLKKNQAQHLTAAELEARWESLAGFNAVVAYQAIGDLALAGDASVAFFKTRLAPAPILNARVTERAARLVADLGSDAFPIRQKAALELDKLGEAALPVLRKVLGGNPSLEVRRRLEKLVDRFEKNSPPSRALEALELIATPNARELLKALAKGEPSARLSQEARATLQRLDGR